MVIADEKYEVLYRTLFQAANRAVRGKGKERHATDEPFEKQQIVQLARRFGIGAALAQVVKKCNEVPVLMTMPDGVERARNEILDAIVYAAAAAIVLAEERRG